MVLTCSTTEGNTMIWFYNGMEIMNSIFIGIINPIGDSRTVEVSGFMFSLELISKRPPAFAISLSFSVDTAMNGDSVSCSAGTQTASSQTLQVMLCPIAMSGY